MVPLFEPLGNICFEIITFYYHVKIGVAYPQAEHFRYLSMAPRDLFNFERCGNACLFQTRDHAPCQGKSRVSKFRFAFPKVMTVGAEAHWTWKLRQLFDYLCDYINQWRIGISIGWLKLTVSKFIIINHGLVAIHQLSIPSLYSSSLLIQKLLFVNHIFTIVTHNHQ